MGNLSFSTALALLKSGSTIARKGWNGSNMYLDLQTPTATSKMLRPYIYICPVDGQLVPWVASQTDLLTEDWYTLT